MAERITLVAANAGGQTLVVELQAGINIDQVLTLLNRGGDIRSNEIIQWAPPPYEGGTTLAKIVGRTAAPTPVWAVQHEHTDCCPVLPEQERGYLPVTS